MRAFKVNHLKLIKAHIPVALVVVLALIYGATEAVAEETSRATDALTEASPSSQVYTDWQVRCDAGQPCRMSQTVAQPATARAILQARVFKGDDPTLLISVPLGILLSPGWRYRIDGRAEAVLPFEICDTAGCHAGIKLTPDLLEALKRGNRLQITFFDAARTAVEPVVSLAGFINAWEALP